MSGAFRIDPALPVGAMKTYETSMPLSTHWRPASCGEVDCPNYLGGWLTILDAVAHADAIEFLRAGTHGWHFTEYIDAGHVSFEFPPGQDCFQVSQHRVQLDKAPIYVVRSGDWRGNPERDGRVHANAEDWIDDFQNHQDKLATRLDQG